MRGKRSVIFIILIIFFSIVGAEEAGITPGGGITPIGDLGIPGSCSNILTCAGQGYTCGTLDNGCGTTLNCGNCASGTCSSGTCVVSGNVTTTPSGGGTVTLVPSNINIQILPTSFNIQLAVNTNKQEFVTISNKGTTQKILSISQNGLDNKVILSNNSISVNAGETKTLGIIFVASNQTGIFNGTIIIGSFIIPVTLNIKTNLLLFDSNIVVLNRNYQVSKTEKLKTKVTLIPMGDKERLDVRLNYAIKDYSGKVYITQSETVLSENRMDFNKDFDIGALPLGKYIVSLDLIYPGGVASSSSHFEIVEKTPVSILGEIMYYLIMMIFIVSIIMVAIIIGDKVRRGEPI